MITFEDIKKDEAIKVYIQRADDVLSKIGYTEHRYAHVYKVANTAMYILRSLGYSEREVELAGIAGYTHDIGNVVWSIDIIHPVVTRKILTLVNLNLLLLVRSSDLGTDGYEIARCKVISPKSLAEKIPLYYCKRECKLVA